MPVVKPSLNRRVEPLKPNKLTRTLSLKDFYHKRNKVLLVRAVGGLGDILMHRMMFEDIKRIMPDAHLTFACPDYYKPAVIDHPYLDAVVSSERYNIEDYMISFNTSTACSRLETKLSPMSAPNRSDIWANHCGFELQNHNMHFRLTEAEKSRGKEILEQHRDRPGPITLVVPISAMQVKNLLDHQLIGTIDGLRDRGLCPIALNKEPIIPLVKKDVPCVFNTSIREWLSVIDQADYVVSVDTAVFHCAGGMGKPLVGIFTFADGKKYGQYYDFFLVQRHRDDDPTWTCGPCYNWPACPKSCANVKPCLTEITPKMIIDKVDMMLQKWPQTSSI